MKKYYKTLIFLGIFVLPVVTSAQSTTVRERQLGVDEQINDITLLEGENASTTASTSPEAIATTTDTTIQREFDQSTRIESIRDEIVNRRKDIISTFKPTTETGQTIQEERQQNVDLLEKRAQETRTEAFEERRASMEERNQNVSNENPGRDRLVTFSQILETRFLAGFSRLETIKKMILSRRAKIESRGIDTSGLDSDFQRIEDDMASLDAEISSAIALLQSLPSVDNPYDGIQRIRLVTNEIKVKMIRINDSLRRVVDELKVLVRAQAQTRSGEMEESATTTE